jgi:hypothetical protein
MLAAGSSAHILLGLCPTRTRDDCTRYSTRTHNRTVMLPEAHPETLSGPTVSTVPRRYSNHDPSPDAGKAITDWQEIY